MTNQINKKEINVLCLHGCNQTQKMFTDLMKPIIQLATTYCKDKEYIISWHFIEANYDHSLGGKTWYNVELDVSKIGQITMDHNMTDQTLNELDTTIKNLKIDVLLGFSQGGNVVDTYLVNKENTIKCAVIFSGYNLIDPDRKQVDLPVINVCSDIDEIVKPEFMPLYKNMIVMRHEKGHKLPTSKPFVRQIIEFIYKNSTLN